MRELQQSLMTVREAAVFLDLNRSLPLERQTGGSAGLPDWQAAPVQAGGGRRVQTQDERAG